MKNLCFFLLFYSFTINAQMNTIQLIENKKSPQASLNDAEWIGGHWRGEAFGGITEEIWSPPLGESMMFVFKLVENDSVVFYESGAIIEQDSTLILKLKHFNRDFIGWEDKDKTVTFNLVKVESNRLFFEGFTFEKIDSNEINIYVNIADNENEVNEVKFNYRRINK